MNFQEFLARKQALALVEHMNALSEADALELFNTLDEETIEFIEAVLSEEQDEEDAPMTKVVKGAIPSAYSQDRLEKPFSVETEKTPKNPSGKVQLKHGMKQDVQQAAADVAKKDADAPGKRSARIKEVESLVAKATDPKQKVALQSKLERMQAADQHATKFAPKRAENQRRATASTLAHYDRLSSKKQ